MEINEEEKFGVFLKRFLNNVIEIQEFYNLSKQLFTNKEIDKQYEWEVINGNIGKGDDYRKVKKTADINEVKKICIEIGSNLIITKPNGQYYIRSPPHLKKNRDYISIKNKADEIESKGRITRWKSYILKP
tara:strand:+ start:409 stop:801 length:393 start_codon:yes stop_codon:yes gene_type:complete